MNREVVLKSKLLNRRLTQLLITARGLIGLGPDRHNLMTVIDQSPQRRHRGLGRAHENNAHKIWRLAALSSAVRLGLTVSGK